MSWPSGVAQSNTHLNTLTMYDDDDDGKEEEEEEEEGLGELEDDYDHNDGAPLTPRGQLLYISVWPS